jgi:multiple sugar transport system substrate-binding protein
MAATPFALGTRPALGQEASQPIATPKPTLSPGPNAVELKYWDMQWGSAIFMSAMQDLVTDFNAEHPEIYVTFQQLSWADYMQKILSAIQSGSPPDMSGGDSGIAFNMAAQDEALDLTDVYKEWEADGTLADMAAWSREKWLWNDMYVGVTWQFDSRAIYYRKDLFADAGIDVPTTWDEFKAAAQALHKPDQGITGLAIPGKQGSFDTDQFYMTLVIQAGGGLADPEGNLTIDSPENLAALKFEKELVDSVTPRGTASWTFTEVLKAFEQGQAAMAFGGGWFIDDMRRNAPDIFKNAGVLPPLVGPGGQESAHIVSFANPWMIYKPTEHPDEAKTFLKWMMKPENLRKLYAAEPGAKWPAYQSLVKDPIYQSNEMLATLAQQTVENGVDYWYPNNAAAVGIASMGTSITDTVVNPVITGNVSPEDALAEAQSRLEPLFRRPGQ